MSNHYPVIIIGAGPAGLTAAYELVKRGIKPLVLEKTDKVGGIARTEMYKGYRFDIGGHRFFTKLIDIQQLWEKMLGEDFIKVPRLSRILFQNHLIKYPLDILNVLTELGVGENLKIIASYLNARIRPDKNEDTYEQWMTNNFGKRLFEIFFKDYTEKVWGIPCHEISSEWATQRIRNFSLKTALSNMLFGKDHGNSLINEFYYPVLGSGLMWQNFRKRLESGGCQVWLNTEVVGLNRNDHQVTCVLLKQNGEEKELQSDHIISSMPLTDLISQFSPPPPDDVIRAASGLKYREFIQVGLVVNRASLFPDNWIYVQVPEVKVGRIQNYKNWSTAMSADQQKTNLGMEYFCSRGDDLWEMSDSELIDLASDELDTLGLAGSGEVEDGVVFRQPKAYPVYDQEYLVNLEVIRGFLSTINNFQTIGRNGMHRYNNQDHSMLTGMLAVRNLFGEDHDLWSVNTERAYAEEVQRSTKL